MRARNILALGAAAGLAGLVGITGAQAQPAEQEPLIVRTEIPGGYRVDRFVNINQGYERDVSFTHECMVENGEEQCNDSLLWAINTSILGKFYKDCSGDGSVDLIDDGRGINYAYLRGERGTEQMFIQADAHLKQIKEELGVH